MLSPKRCAQLGVAAAGFVLVGSSLVLMFGAADRPTGTAQASAQPTARTPIATIPEPAGLAQR